MPGSVDREYISEYVRTTGDQKHLEQYPASDPKQRTLSDFIN